MKLIEKARLLLRANRIYGQFKKIKKEESMEKKTELSLIAVVEVLILAGAVVKFIPAETAAIIGGVLAGLYTIARTVVKVTKTTKDDEILEKVDEHILSLIDTLKKR